MLKKILIFFLLFFSSIVTASAGVRGYYIVFADMRVQEKDPVLKAFYEYFNKEDKQNDSCFFEWIYMKRRPNGLNNDLISKALNEDKHSLLKIQAILKNYSDDMVNHFDGLITYERLDKKIVLTGIGIGKHPIVKVQATLTSHDAIQEKTIDQLLCRAAAPFQETFSP